MDGQLKKATNTESGIKQKPSLSAPSPAGGRGPGLVTPKLGDGG
jgi:hypothetical protein